MQSPAEVWIALPPRTWAPTLQWPATRVVRFSGARFELGIKKHVEEGVALRVFDVTKTVVDCFRYRHKLGLDVALEALRESLRSRRTTKSKLWEMARLQRASTAIKPYLEAS